jgi:hypothetical protein
MSTLGLALLTGYLLGTGVCELSGWLKNRRERRMRAEMREESLRQWRARWNEDE